MAMSKQRAQLERMLDAEVDRRFEVEILDRLRGKRLSPLAKKAETQTDEKPADEDAMSDDDLALLQVLDQDSGDNNAAA